MQRGWPSRRRYPPPPSPLEDVKLHDSISATLIRRLATANHAVVLTGAGVSAESGIPTFRDPGGLWEQFKPSELANVRAFLHNPLLVQGWYRHRREVASNTTPNPAHLAIRDLEELIANLTLVTQNVDDLHRRAGSRNVLELHGNIMRSYCIDCDREAPEPTSTEDLETGARRCAGCGGLIRPGVVWFGEPLPSREIEEAYRAAERSEVLLSVGTSAEVYPAAWLPATARQSGAYVAEFNLRPSAIASQVDEVVLGPAGVTLPRLVDSVRSYQREHSRKI